MVPLTSDEIQHIASTSAKAAVRELLVTLGIDSTSPGALIEMQKDFAQVRKWRQSVETVQTRGLMVATGIVVSGIIGAVWMAIKSGGTH